MNKEEIQNMLAVNRSINDMEQNFRKKIEDLQQRIDKAIEIAYEYGQIDGNHHKLWVIDQMIRRLLDNKYDDFIKDYEEDGKYIWDTGIAP